MLLSNTYQAYVGEIIKLVRSLVIKNVQTINAINSFLTLAGDNLSNDPHDWKYYRNLAGLRYIGTSGLNDDPVIMIYSLDTNVNIVFAPNTIINHPLTLSELKARGESYTTLLTLHPDQELLINGVIYPVNIDNAINAVHCQILQWNTDYVYEHETSLIKDLQQWIYNYSSRWMAPAFAATDSLYVTSSFANLVLNLVPDIINIRLNYCKTPQAHPFHVWNYLANYFNLDIHKPYLNIQQALFLYRNIEYIIANSGRQEILDYLNEAFALPFGLQLVNHNILQNIDNSLERLTNNQYDQINTVIDVIKYQYGTVNFASDNYRTIKPRNFVQLIQKQATYNPDNIEYDIAHLVERVSHTPVTEIPTGFIECNAIRTSTINMVSEVQERIHNWLYMAANDYIKFKYELKLPADNIHLILSADDAAVFLLYASAKLFGVTLTNIYHPRVREIMLPPIVNETAIRGVIESKICNGFFTYGVNGYKSWDRYQQVAAMQTLPVQVNSLKDFNTHIHNIIASKVQHLLLPALEPTALGQSEIKALIQMFYQRQYCTFVSETTFEAFFTRLGLPHYLTISDPSIASAVELICKDYIGIDPETSFLQHPYSDMVEILAKLCSYTVDFVAGNPTNNIEPIDWDFLIFNKGLTGDTSNGTIVQDDTIIISHGLDVDLINNPIFSVVDLAKGDLPNIATVELHPVIRAELYAGLEVFEIRDLIDTNNIEPSGLWPQIVTP